VAIGWPVIGKLMVVHLIQIFLALLNPNPSQLNPVQALLQYPCDISVGT